MLEVVLAFLIAGLIFAVSRLFTSRFKFEDILGAVGVTFAFIPVLLWTFIFCAAGVFGIVLIATAILRALGYLSLVEQLAIWGLMPRWAWIIGPAGVLYMICILVGWRNEIRRALRFK